MLRKCLWIVCTMVVVWVCLRYSRRGLRDGVYLAYRPDIMEVWECIAN